MRLSGNREMILSTVAPQYIPSVAPSVEYLAPQVPVPIPPATTQSMLVVCHVTSVLFHCIVSCD